MAKAPIDESTAFGRRVAQRLRDEKLIWLTTVGRDGTPQPNPVWFLWDGGDQVTVYNAVDARRMRHIEERPQVSLHFDTKADGGGVMVLRGQAVRAPELPSSDQNREHQRKYGEAIRTGGWGTAEEFDRLYPHKMRIRIQDVRGF